MRTIAAACFLALLSIGARAAERPADPDVSAVMAKLSMPSAKAIERFTASGMQGIRPHSLAPDERLAVERAIAALPALHRQVLADRLHSLSFVDGLPGAGTGLTSKVDGGNTYDITLRASLIAESLSHFLTVKERRVFQPAGGAVVTVRGEGVDALTYVLLHESTHVVDATLGLTRELKTPLTQGVWTDRATPVERIAHEPAARTAFRGAPPLPASDATEVYRSLSRTPFVSLYATASSSEDLAELVSWYVVETRYKGTLTISVNAVDGAKAETFRPLGFPGVRARFPEVGKLLSVHFVANAPSA